MNNDRRSKLAVGYVKCKSLMTDGGADELSLIRVEDIMLASIRTLDFMWDNNAEKSMDYVLECILKKMALVAADAIRGDQDKIYIAMVS